MGSRGRQGRRRRPTKKIAPVIAIAWFEPEEWDQLRQIAADGDQLASYEEWKTTEEANIRQLEREGVVVEKVVVDLSELKVWCDGNGLTLDRMARASFATHKLRKRHEEDL